MIRAWLKRLTQPSAPEVRPAPTSCCLCGGSLPHNTCPGPGQKSCSCNGQPMTAGTTTRSMSRRDQSENYISSRAWAEKRREFRAWWSSTHTGGWCCARCGSKQLLHVHHTSYRNFGHEALEDLLPLCATCHSQIHSNAPQGRDEYLEQLFEHLVQALAISV
jgi:DNA-directed RNA polymerase subunit RPC12/RpoP